jgi:hypothetical protein
MKETLDSSLKKVLSQANADQNQHYPPHVFDVHFNLVTKALLGEIIKSWPTNNTIKMLAKPFLRTKVIPVKDGLIEFPKEFWNFLNASIYLNDDKTEACQAPDITPEEAINQRLKNRSNSRVANEVDQKMWEYLIDHSYKQPTLEKPIICMFEAEGYRIEPYNVPSVQFTWLVEPKEYKYGYIMNPDDTYQYDPTQGVESEWDITAAEYLFKGMNILYSAYVRDVEQREWAQLLNKQGLF